MAKNENMGALFFYGDFCAFEDSMSDQELGQVFRAVMYIRMGSTPDLDRLNALQRCAFNIFTASAKAALDKKVAIYEVRAQAGRARWKEDTQAISDVSEELCTANESDDHFAKQNDFCLANDSDENFAKQPVHQYNTTQPKEIQPNPTEYNSTQSNPSEPPVRERVIPSFSEIKLFSEQAGLGVSDEAIRQFMRHNSACDWRFQGMPIMDWKRWFTNYVTRFKGGETHEVSGGNSGQLHDYFTTV